MGAARQMGGSVKVRLGGAVEDVRPAASNERMVGRHAALAGSGGATSRHGAPRTGWERVLWELAMLDQAEAAPEETLYVLAREWLLHEVDSLLTASPS